MSKSSHWHQPVTLLILMSIAMPLAHAVWMALLNNFAVERAGFDGARIGLLQSVREIPGFLAFTAVFLLAVVREQKLALMALALLGLGVVATGWFPSTVGLFVTTFIMSLGFHYFETLKQSLSLQWLEPAETPAVLGRLIAVGAATSLMLYAVLWFLLDPLALDYRWVYALGGGACLALVGIMASFPHFPGRAEQHRRLILRKRYWLYYALTFMSGARRQIFMVFAAFLLVERFGLSAADIALLYGLNHALSWAFAARIGRWIGRVGERRALTLEYAGLVAVFIAYPLVTSREAAAALYLVDHLFFAMAIAIKTYFQKIADPADFAATAGVAFTINHIAAVVIPAGFGLIWLISPTAVFWLGALMAAASLTMAQWIPPRPGPGRETRFAAAVPSGE